jgi:hypothetical protein
MLTPFHTLKTEPTHVWPPSLTAQNRTATVNSSKGFFRVGSNHICSLKGYNPYQFSAPRGV